MKSHHLSQSPPLSVTRMWDGARVGGKGVSSRPGRWVGSVHNPASSEKEKTWTSEHSFTHCTPCTARDRARGDRLAVVFSWLLTLRGVQPTRKTKGVHRTCPCAPSPLVFPPLVFVCSFVCSSWCDGSGCVWRLHTDHPSVRRRGVVDALVVAFLVKATF